MNPEGESYPRTDETFLDRVVEEILDPVDYYWAGDGPEGSWEYKSLAVYRKMNRIIVYNVDGDLCDTLEVPDLSDVREPHVKLMAKLNQIHEREMDAL